VLAEDIVPAIDVPGHDNTAMDGYAVRFADLGAGATVLEEIGAGSVPRRPVTPGTATRLMTGAPLESHRSSLERRPRRGAAGYG